MTQDQGPRPAEPGHTPEGHTLSDDDHGHAEERLGPIDWSAWSYALVGTLAGVAVLAGFWLALV